MPERITLEMVGKILSKPLINNGTGKIIRFIVWIIVSIGTVAICGNKVIENSKRVPIVERELQEHKESNVRSFSKVDSTLGVMSNNIEWLCKQNNEQKFEKYQLETKGAKKLIMIK